MEEFEAVSLVIISLGAFILPLMAQRVKIPGIVLEIAFGIVVGPLLGLVDSSEFINGLAILGFLLLMFLSGFEIDQDHMLIRFKRLLLWNKGRERWVKPLRQRSTENISTR